MKKIACLATFLTALTLISEAEARTVYVEQTVPNYVMVEQQPPADLTEEIVESPGPDYIWLRGHWRYDNGWVWARGRWERRPHAEAVWEPGYWGHKHHHYVWVGGYWR